MGRKKTPFELAVFLAMARHGLTMVTLAKEINYKSPATLTSAIRYGTLRELKFIELCKRLKLDPVDMFRLKIKKYEN
jgi:hypothetical protein